ncbi:sigma-70 family RNA polymerase sigma factor [Thalassoglobus sp. JC818]|uniref:RNA polymerase sigma factor n=1 Tax=Thalassoglobus sp. JC818 TaxID=3232136 RepID=UPI0034597862
MSVNFDIPTRLSMFVHLQANEEQAWSEFVRQYGPMIASWCMRYNLDETETADVTQTVLIKLVQVMRESRYDSNKGSFRGWLKTVTNNAVRDVIRTWHKPGRGSGDSVNLDRLSALEDPAALETLNECVDEEYKRILLHEAERRVRERVRDFTWRAFEITTLEQRSAKEASEELNMKIAEIYVAKSRVIKMLNEEVARQEEELEGNQSDQS